MGQAARKVIRPVEFRRSRKTAEDKQQRDARMLYAAIEAKFGRMVIFRRDDLMRLNILRSSGVKTRYNDICLAIELLFRSKRLFQVSRSELSLASNVAEAKAQAGHALLDAYRRKVGNLVGWHRQEHPRAAFDVMTIVESWTSDPHLSDDVKRYTVRGILQRMARDKEIRRSPAGPHSYY